MNSVHERILTGGKDMTYTHVYIPRWICHDNMELAQDGIVELAKVTIDPLRRELRRAVQ